MEVVVDSSALIPLSWTGSLWLIDETFEAIHTSEDVRGEVLTEGKPGTDALRSFLENATVHPTPPTANRLADLEGVTVADSSVILLADSLSAALLVNDKGLVEVARTRGIDCWWVTTLLLKSTKSGVLMAEEAVDLLYELVDGGMNLHPRVYARVERALRGLNG